MKRTMKQHPQYMSFTLMFPRLGKVFNYCKMIGSHARWWNDLVLSGDFILFHRVGNNASGVSPWWNYFLLSPLRFMQKVQFCWHGALINVHDILMKPPLRLALMNPSYPLFLVSSLSYPFCPSSDLSRPLLRNRNIIVSYLKEREVHGEWCWSPSHRLSACQAGSGEARKDMFGLVIFLLHLLVTVL